MSLLHRVYPVSSCMRPHTRLRLVGPFNASSALQSNWRVGRSTRSPLRHGSVGYHQCFRSIRSWLRRLTRQLRSRCSCTDIAHAPVQHGLRCDKLARTTHSQSPIGKISGIACDLSTCPFSITRRIRPNSRTRPELAHFDIRGATAILSGHVHSLSAKRCLLGSAQMPGCQ